MSFTLKVLKKNSYEKRENISASLGSSKHSNSIDGIVQEDSANDSGSDCLIYENVVKDIDR